MDKKIGRDPHISIRLPRTQIAYATRLAKERSVSRSKLIRELINQTPVLWPMVQPDQPVQVQG